MALTGDKGTYSLKALTDLWTGNRCQESGRLITTGLLGSIRWWFEVLVRGLGGGACDPTHSKCSDRDHCAVCELFGCTGWARKFRFQVLDDNGRTRMDQIKQSRTFQLRFIPLRPICAEEWALLDATLRLIAEYGAIGGKTVLKPSDERGREHKPYHKDYGLVELNQSPKIVPIPREDLQKYLSKWGRLDAGEFAWASLEHFWCVKGKYLGRQNGTSSSFNLVIGRPEQKGRTAQRDSWIAGRRPDPKKRVEAESKKVFSFKNPARTFGFVKPGSIGFSTVNGLLTSAWGQNGWDLLTRDKIVDRLFAWNGERP